MARVSKFYNARVTKEFEWEEYTTCMRITTHLTEVSIGARLALYDAETDRVMHVELDLEELQEMQREVNNKLMEITRQVYE